MFSIQAKVLFNALSNAITGNKVLPILDSVLIRVEGLKMTIKSSDLAVYLTETLDLDSSSQDVAFCINTTYLKNALKGLNEPIRIRLTEKADFLNLGKNVPVIIIETSNGNFTFPNEIDVADYPKEPEIENTTEGNLLDSSQLAKMLPFCSKDKLRPSMTGIFFGKEHLVATDAHKLIYLPCEEYEEFIICPLTAKIACQYDNLMVYNSKPGKGILLANDNVRIVATTIDSKYPDYNAVIPKQNDFKVFFGVDRKELIAVLGKILPFTNSANQIKISVNKTSLQVSATDLDFQHQVSLEIACNSDDVIEMGFNGNFLLTTIKAIPDSELVFNCVSPNRCAIINDCTLVMPVLLDKEVTA